MTNQRLSQILFFAQGFLGTENMTTNDLFYVKVPSLTLLYQIKDKCMLLSFSQPVIKVRYIYSVEIFLGFGEPN